MHEDYKYRRYFIMELVIDGTVVERCKTYDRRQNINNFTRLRSYATKQKLPWEIHQLLSSKMLHKKVLNLINY